MTCCSCYLQTAASVNMQVDVQQASPIGPASHISMPSTLLFPHITAPAPPKQVPLVSSTLPTVRRLQAENSWT